MSLRTILLRYIYLYILSHVNPYTLSFLYIETKTPEFLYLRLKLLQI